MGKDKVYVTYSNERYNPVAGIYASERDALEAIKQSNGNLSNILDIYTLQGYRGEEYDYLLTDNCKYYKPHLNTIRELISCLYQLEGCCGGGLCHIVTDDDNIDDESLLCVIEQAKANPEETESGLAILICEELLKLSLPERALLFSNFYTDILCEHRCSECPIDHGCIAKPKI